MTTDDKLAVSQEAREAAYEIEAAFDEATNNPCTCATDEMGCPYCNAWAKAEKASCEIIARFEAQARLAGERAGMEPLDALAKHTNWELTHGGWEDEEQVWKVHSVNGGRNDREWTLLGAGETPAEAIRAAILKEAASITPKGDV